MPHINLIQEQRSQARRNETKARGGFFAFVAITSLSAAAYGALFLQVDSLTSKQAKLQAELQKLEPIKKQIESNKAIAAELQPRLASLQEAQQITDRWVSILTHFTTQVPPNTWLTQMRCQTMDPDQPVGLILMGMAVSQEPIGEFMLRTQNEANLEAVTLKYTNEKPTVNGPAIEFEVDANVKGTASEKTKEEDKKS